MGRVATVSKYAFSDDSRSTLGTGLSTAANNCCGMANSGTAGYVALGYPSGYSTTVDKFAFSDDSRTSLSSGLSTARYASSAFANSGTAGYMCGGYRNAAPKQTDIVDKWSFSDDSRSTLGTGLSTGVYNACGFAHSGTAGFSAGGSSSASADLTFVDKFAFASDSRASATALATGGSYAAAFADSGSL